jgi:hypothetical protein
MGLYNLKDNWKAFSEYDPDLRSSEHDYYKRCPAFIHQGTGTRLGTVDLYAYMASVLKVPVVYLSHHFKPKVTLGTTAPAVLDDSTGKSVTFYPVFEATVMKFKDQGVEVGSDGLKEHSKLAFFVWKGQQYMCVGGETPA